MQTTYNPYYSNYKKNKPCYNCKGTGLYENRVCERCHGNGYIYSKFNAQRTEYNGRVYDSKKEAEKAMELDLLVKGGEVLSWEYEPVFLIIKRFILRGKIFLPTRYKPDFKVYIKPGTKTHEIYGADVVVIDTKGFPTPEWKIKRKLFQREYPDIKLIIE